jgi:cysteinyl-tRNA synthetase
LDVRIYNTLSGVKELFEPVTPGVVRMYVCGPTVYDYSHVGHARTYVTFDVVRRFFEFIGYSVIYVQNITDIDDKIINRAIKENREWKEISDYYIKAYLEDMDKLLVKRAYIQPRVTEHISDIIDFINKLIAKGHAYVSSDGSVYFDVDSYMPYGELSKIKRNELKPIELGEGKRKVYDFALWKAFKPNEPYWESPWGKGRPGWHIECSVMSSKYLGEEFDIHGGGQDLVFPHHENERAQSEALFGHKWVRYWMHTGLVTVLGQRMGKSMGNMVPLRELLSKFKPEVIRLYLLGTQYRSPLEFSFEGVENAAQSYEKLLSSVELLIKLSKELEPSYKLSEKELAVMEDLVNIEKGFLNAMSDDFNTPVALTYLYKLHSIVKGIIAYNPTYAIVSKALHLFQDFSNVFGLFEKQFTQITEGRGDLTEKVIDLLIEVRQRHRKIKDYETADWIASELRKLGIELEDFKDKTTWRIKQITPS